MTSDARKRALNVYTSNDPEPDSDVVETVRDAREEYRLAVQLLDTEAAAHHDYMLTKWITNLLKNRGCA